MNSQAISRFQQGTTKSAYPPTSSNFTMHPSRSAKHTLLHRMSAPMTRSYLDLQFTCSDMDRQARIMPESIPFLWQLLLRLSTTWGRLSVAAILPALVNLRAAMEAMPVPASSSTTDLPENSYLFLTMQRAKIMCESHRCRPSNPPEGKERMSPMMTLRLFLKSTMISRSRSSRSNFCCAGLVGPGCGAELPIRIIIGKCIGAQCENMRCRTITR